MRRLLACLAALSAACDLEGPAGPAGPAGAADSGPTAVIRVDRRAGVAPLEVRFGAVVVGAEGSLGYAWDFGDGQTSTEAGPLHTFAAAGTYTATVTVTDGRDRSALALAEIAVGSDEFPEVAGFAEVVRGVSPLEVRFVAAAAGGNGALTFAWDFGDGASSTLQDPRHTYATALDQTFTASVTATDEDGDTATADVVVVVEADVTPMGVVAQATPATGRAPFLVQLGCDASGGNAPLAYAWTFGDGGQSTLQDPAYVYRDPGTYVATCLVTDADGDQAQDTATVTVLLDGAPAVTLSADVTSGVAPLTVTFAATASGGDGPLALSWDFGDGTVLAGGSASQSHTYGAGTYEVAVTVVDVDGDVHRATRVITVTPEGPPIEVAASASPARGIAPLEVTFSAAIAGGNPPFTFQWDFGGVGASALAAPTVTFPPGTYEVTVTATDVDGDAAPPASVEVVVEEELLPVLGALTAIASDPLHLPPSRVDFTCPVTAPGNAPYTFAWSFGDGSGAAEQDPSHTYQAAGEYRAICTVTDADGDSDTRDVVLVVAEDLRPEATILGGPLSGPAPLEVDFRAAATAGNGPIIYLWDFGDPAIPGVEAFDPNPVTYENPGTYYVTLTATDADDVSFATAIVVVEP
jgi:PKD repeat protein